MLHTRPRLLALMSFVAMLAVAACGSAPGSKAPTVVATSTNAAVVSPTPTPTAVATKPAGPIAIPDGVYSTGPRSVADIRAEIAANHKLSEAERAVLANDMFNLGDSKTMTVSIELNNGQWTQRQQLDQGRNGVGSRATYAFPDDHTVVIQEACCGISTFNVDRNGDSFRLTYASVPAPTLDQVAGHILFEEAPFTLVP